MWNFQIFLVDTCVCVNIMVIYGRISWVQQDENLGISSVWCKWKTINLTHDNNSPFSLPIIKLLIIVRHDSCMLDCFTLSLSLTHPPTIKPRLVVFCMHKQYFVSRFSVYKEWLTRQTKNPLFILPLCQADHPSIRRPFRKYKSFRFSRKSYKLPHNTVS